MTSPLDNLLSPALVKLDLRAPGEESAIRAVAGLLAGHPGVSDADRLAAELIERENLCPTAMGHGVAFPHARTAAVSEIVMAVGRSTEGVRFHGADEEVNFLFVIGTPPDRVAQYLGVVGKLARLLKSDALRQRLLAAPSAQEFVETLRAAG